MGMKQKLNPLSGWFDMVNSTGTNPGDAVVLDGNGKIPVSTIPATAITERFVAASQAEMLALDAQIGDICARTDENKIYQLMNNDPSVLANWIATNVVSSVNNQTGDVVVNDVKIGSTAPTNPTEGMVWYDTTNDLFKTYNGVGWDIPGQTLKSFPVEFNTTGTTAQFLSSITAMNLPVGMSYLGQVSLSDMPDGISVQAEVQVDIYPQNVVYATMRSAEVSPYEWMVNSYDNRGREAVDKTANDYTDSRISRGTTAPTNPTKGQLWYDTTNDVLKMYNGSIWVINGKGDMEYSDFNFVTLSGASVTLSLCSKIVPSGNFTINAPATTKDGTSYLLRVENGATAYTMTLGTGITNPDSADLTLEADKINQFVFLAVNGSLELQKPAAGGNSEYMEDIRNKTNEIYGSGELPDSEASDTWIFTSDGLHGAMFDGTQAKVYSLDTAFDIDGTKTLLSTVTAPGNINMGLLNNEGTRLIMLGYLSTWRIMYGVSPDEGGTAFVFDNDSPEYTWDDYQNRQSSVPYFKSTTYTTDFTESYVYDEVTQQNYVVSDMKFAGMCCESWAFWYLYQPTLKRVCEVAIGENEWNSSFFSINQFFPSMDSPDDVTAIYRTGDGWSGPSYAYAKKDGDTAYRWYKPYVNSYLWPDFYGSYNWPFYADGTSEIGTCNDSMAFIGGKKFFINPNRYLGYGATKQIVTKNNIRGYGNDTEDDTINVPSFYRYQSDVSGLEYRKQDKITYSIERQTNKVTSQNPYPFSQTQQIEYSNFSVSFYNSGAYAFLSNGYDLYYGAVTTPYEFTDTDKETILNSGNYINMGSYGVINSFGQAYLSEDGYHIICRDHNNGSMVVVDLSTPFDLTSVQTNTTSSIGTSSAIFNYDGTAIWKREVNPNDNKYYWAKYTGTAYDYENFTFVEYQGQLTISGWEWQNTAFAFSFDGKYLIAYDNTGIVIKMYKLSTPRDLSTIVIYQDFGMDDSRQNCYLGIPTEKFVWLSHDYDGRNLSFKYSYDDSVAYPSIAITTKAAAEGFKPVTDTTSTSSLTISNLTTVFTPTQDFSLVAGTVMPGMSYIVRLTSGATAYTMTLGTGITNPYGETLTLTASKTTTVVFFATSDSTLELFGIKTEA